MKSIDRNDIFKELHNMAGLCMTCKMVGCPDGKNTTLPNNLPTHVVLSAINNAFDKKEGNNEYVEDIAVPSTPKTDIGILGTVNDL